MSAKMTCLGAVALGVLAGSCLPSAEADQTEAESSITTGEAAFSADAPLEIAISQFPGSYQGRWALSREACASDPENSTDVISLQGKLVKFHESIGTMTTGKRETSRSMVADFDFVGEGEKWTKSIAFALSEDRKALIRKDGDDATTYRYVQCPKLMAG